MSGPPVRRAPPILALACAAALAFAPAAAPAAPTLTRAQMEAALAGAPPFRFVYGTRDPAAAPRLRALAAGIAARLFGADSTRVAADRDLSEADLAASGVVLVGNARENAWTAKLAESLPVRFTERGFRWQGTAYEQPGEALALSYPNPLAPRRFLLVVAGNSAAALASPRAWLPGEDDWRVTRDGDVVRAGRFAQAPAPWRYDAALDHDRDAARARWTAALLAQGGAPLVVRAPRGVAAAAGVRTAGVALLQALDRRGLAAPARAPALSLTLYRSLEEKGALVRDTRPEQLARGAVHAALPAGRTALDLWSVAAARLVQLGAAERSPYLEPAGAWLAGRWGGEALERAVARAYDGRLLPTPEAAARPDGGSASALVRVPARALLVRAASECAPAPRAALLALLRGTAPVSLAELARTARTDPARLAARYRALADSLARAARPALALAHPRPWRPADGFMRGVAFAHVVDLERGYLAGAAAAELARLRDAHAGWVSLAPVGYLPEARAPQILSSAAGAPDEETDEAVCEAAARARALGLRVWLAPELRTRGWIGDLAFATDDWPRFFEQWRAFVLHWALLAERERVDGLVLGRELASVTAKHPERVRALIAEVRAVYTGTLTYAAQWDEAQRVPFWDALDLVGVTFGAPLAAQPEAGEGALRAGAAKAVGALGALARRTGRPVLVCALGYPAAPTAAVRPWDPGRGAPDAEAQRACLAAAVDALDAPDWLAGASFGPWPASAADGDAFSPRGRVAETVVKQALARWVERPVRVPRSGAAR